MGPYLTPPRSLWGFLSHRSTPPPLWFPPYCFALGLSGHPRHSLKGTRLSEAREDSFKPCRLVLRSLWILAETHNLDQHLDYFGEWT